MNQFKSAKIAYVVFALVIFSLVANIVYLGVTGKHLISGADIATFAKSRGKAKTIDYATRGEIYTSDNEVVASNVKKYKLIAIVSSSRINHGKDDAYVKDITATANAIAPIIGMDPTVMAQKLQEKVDAGAYQVEFGTNGNDLSAGVKKQIEDTGLPGLEFIESNSRNYPYGDFCSYIIGYAKGTETDGVKGLVGEMGLEAIYDKTLSGENGYKVYQKDSKGYVLPDGILEQKDAVDGDDIYLTIDSSLQRDLDYQLATEAAAAQALKASCVIMEAKTGKILALSSYPSFNPNERNIEDYKNFFFDTAYECGSVFKSFVYASSIESGLYNGAATYESGKYDYGGSRPIRDHNNGAGWGSISYDEGFYRSSNVAICNLLERGYTNRDELLDVYEKLGFFQSSNIDGFDSVAGTALYKTDKSRAAYLTTGFGQGSTVTALQLLRAYSVFANDGKTVEPYLIEKIVNKAYIKGGNVDEQGEQWLCSVENLESQLKYGVQEAVWSLPSAYAVSDAQRWGLNQINRYKEPIKAVKISNIVLEYPKPDGSFFVRKLSTQGQAAITDLDGFRYDYPIIKLKYNISGKDGIKLDVELGEQPFSIDRYFADLDRNAKLAELLQQASTKQLKIGG